MEVPKIVKNLTLPFDQVNASVSGEIVDEGDEIAAPANTHFLCQCPHIRVDKIEPIPALILLIGEWNVMLLPVLACFTYICPFRPLNLGSP